MKNFIRSRWVPLLAVILLIIIRIPYLNYPFFWDESIPYASAIHAMYLHGPSLLPSSLDPELSRGHPLLLHFLASSWMKISGPGRVPGHTFALVIAIATLIYLYEAVRELFGSKAAIIALLFLGLQPIFVVQSIAVVPEMMVALFTIISLHTYATRRYLWAGLSLTALFFTKESGLVLGIVIGLHAATGLFDRNEPFGQRVRALSAVAIPTILIASFFILQKHTFGWYIFPYHEEIMHHKWPDFWFHIRRSSLATIFQGHFKYYLYMPLALLAIVIAVRYKAYLYLTILLPIVAYGFIINNGGNGQFPQSVLFFTIFVATSLMAIYVYAYSFWPTHRPGRSFLLLAGLFLLLYLIFCAANFYVQRYSLVAQCVLAALVAGWYSHVIKKLSWNWLYTGVAACIIIVGFCAFRYDPDSSDVDMASYQTAAMQLAEIRYMEQHHLQNATIGAGGYLCREHLKDAGCGYLDGAPFTHVSWYIDAATGYAIFDNVEPDSRYNDFLKDTSFHRVYLYEAQGLKAEIFKRNSLP